MGRPTLPSQLTRSCLGHSEVPSLSLSRPKTWQTPQWVQQGSLSPGKAGITYTLNSLRTWRNLTSNTCTHNNGEEAMVILGHGRPLTRLQSWGQSHLPPC